MHPFLPAMSGPILKQSVLARSALENINPKSDPGSSSPCKATPHSTPLSALHRVRFAYEVGLGFICEGFVRIPGDGAQREENIMDGTNLPLATGESNVNESAGVCDSLLRAALGGLFLLLRLNLLI